MKNVGRQSSDESAALILFGRNRFEYISRVTWIPSPTGGTWLNISRLKAFARIDFGGMQCIDSSKFGALKIRSEWYVMIGRPPVVSANEWAAGGRRSVNSKAASGRKWESGLVSFSPSWCNPRVWLARKSKKFLDEGNKKRGATRDAPRAVASCWLLFFSTANGRKHIPKATGRLLLRTCFLIAPYYYSWGQVIFTLRPLGVIVLTRQKPLSPLVCLPKLNKLLPLPAGHSSLFSSFLCRCR